MLRGKNLSNGSTSLLMVYVLLYVVEFEFVLMVRLPYFLRRRIFRV